MAVATFTKTGAKATKAATLNKEIFSKEVASYDLLKLSYNRTLAERRQGSVGTKTRAAVRGGGRKPWRQKGTGRARVGSIRSPLWRGGGITFGPSGNENYSKKVSKTAKRTALKQALSLANKDGNIIVVEAFDFKDGKTAAAAAFLKKIGTTRRTLLVTADTTDNFTRATNNLANVLTTRSEYLTVFDVLNADTIVLDSAAVTAIEAWLGGSNA